MGDAALDNVAVGGGCSRSPSHNISGMVCLVGVDSRSGVECQGCEVAPNTTRRRCTCQHCKFRHPGSLHCFCAIGHGSLPMSPSRAAKGSWCNIEAYGLQSHCVSIPGYHVRLIALFPSQRYNWRSLCQDQARWMPFSPPASEGASKP